MKAKRNVPVYILVILAMLLAVFPGSPAILAQSGIVIDGVKEAD